jgi:hypothetical protein
MSFNTENTPIIELAVVGALIALGKLLVGRKKITLRLCAGRVIIGAALSMVAGAILAMIPDIPITALIGLGSALGICGQSILEAAVQHWVHVPHDEC